MKKKVIIRENNNFKILVDLIFYVLVSILGYLLLDYENFNIVNNYMLLPSIFYIIAALSILAYYVIKRKDDYDYLIYSLINVICGTYILSPNYYHNTFIIGDALLIYAAGIVVCKFLSARKLWREKNTNFIFKLSNSFVILFISIIAVYTLYSKEDVSNMIIGYYLIGFGLLNLLEPLANIILSNPNIDRFLISILKYNEKESLKNKKTIKTITKKRIKAKK